MDFCACMICQYIYDGEYFWNIHGTSKNEDRHLLCTQCLIKFAKKNIQCPYKCTSEFNPIQLQPGYKQLITNQNNDYIK